MVKTMNEIDVLINNLDDIKNKFNDKKFSKDFYDYIEIENNKNSDKKGNIINFDIVDDIKDDEKEEIQKIFKDHYSRLVDDLTEHIMAENGKEIFLVIFGLIFLSLYYLFQSHDVIIISDVFLIIGWLSVWEAIYGLIFVVNENKNKLKQYKKLLNAKIKFVR